jgi:stage III sporulation protein AD
MDNFFQITAGILLCVVLSIVMKRYGSEFGMILSLCVCALVAITALRILQPVLAYIQRLQSLTSLDSSMLQILLKVVGVSLTAEIAITVCEDSGNGSMGKALQILTSAIILYISLPMLTAFLDLVENILGKL